MPRKPKPKPDDPAEYKRFLETAKQVEADKDPRVFDRAFEKVAIRKKPSRAASGPKKREA